MSGCLGFFQMTIQRSFTSHTSEIARESAMDEQPPFIVLLEACLRLGTDPHFDPHELWILFATHSFAQQSLIKAVQRYRRHVPSIEFDDLMQEVSLLFGQKVLRGKPLRLDRERAGRTFGAWWRKVVENSVREAGRRLRVLHKPASLATMPDRFAAVEQWNAWFKRLDVRNAICRLRSEHIKVLLDFYHGYDSTQRADKRSIVCESSEKLLDEALKRLEHELRDYR